MELVILKIGGSVITHKESSFPKMDYKNLEIVANQLKEIKQPYVLVHGAGSFGHPIARKAKIDINKGIENEKQILIVAEAQRLQNKLNCFVAQALIKKGIPAMPCQPSSHAVLRKGRIKRMETKAISGMLKLGLIPVCYGVPAFDEFFGIVVLSGDQITPYLAQKLKAKRIIEASGVDGIYTSDPKVNKKAKKIKEINVQNFEEIKKCLSGSRAIDVSGGMLQKYLELIKSAKKGIKCQIIHFKDIKKAFEGKRVGTIISLR
jgi:isopentenyl phosphate kinase